MDPVEKLKKKMIEKLRESGAPAAAVDAVDFLTPDDVTDLGISAAATLIPGGLVASKAIKTVGKGSAKAAKLADKIQFGVMTGGSAAGLGTVAEAAKDFTRIPRYDKEVSKLAQQLGISKSEAREVYRELYPKEEYAYPDYDEEVKSRIRQNPKLKYERPTE